MSDFKWRHYRGEMILGCVRWYCKYGISYRELEEMMLERGLEVDHTTLYRWVQHYAPEMEKRLRWHWKPSIGYSWRVDETYVKVKGKWAYLYRAIDKMGCTIDFYLSATRNIKAAKRFLGKALKSIKSWAHPMVINTDKALACQPFRGHTFEKSLHLPQTQQVEWLYFRGQVLYKDLTLKEYYHDKEKEYLFA